MVMERPSRGVALGGASAGVGAVSQTVADHLAAGRDIFPSVWLERGGRLRCVASTGEWPGRDGVSPTAGVVGATFTSGVETVIPSITGDAGRPFTEACVPVRAAGCLVGVLDVRLARPLRAGDLERFRAAAVELGHRIDALGGPPAESAAQRMLRHMTRLSALDEPDAIARAVLAAAIDLMELDSAALVRRDGPDGDAANGPVAAAGPRAAGDAPVEPPPPLHAVATIGPLGPALAIAPADTLQAIANAAIDGAAGVVIATEQDLARPELAKLSTAGAKTLLAVGLVAHAEPHGVLVLAGRSDRAVSIDDLELLELLAAHAATCLRTAGLVRSLRTQAATDPLTGLGHHATFHATLAYAHRRPRTAVVLMDLDGFKRLNDTFGHQHGDQILRGVAGALSGALRRGDTLFRIGGDEFAALLVVADRDEALEAADRLRAAVNEANLGVTVSIGVAVPMEDELDAALLARADRALYRAKDAGRDGVAIAAQVDAGADGERAGEDPAPVAPPL
jgi:diguanylate cyclase (GGDEF)-like protein